MSNVNPPQEEGDQFTSKIDSTFSKYYKTKDKPEK